jgi:type III secretion protein V
MEAVDLVKQQIEDVKQLYKKQGVGALIGKYSDIMLVAIIMSIIGMMIVPLPTFLLDLLLTVNISFAVMLLLISLYVSEPIKIASFPTILLVTTLFRLALEISSTRLILLHGYAGEVIESFGKFVVAGNFVVGAVIFLILTLIQFIVIAKGSERVAEVSARFTLDAMPGKQMAIDADLRSGAIDMNEGKARRRALERESQFFGSMDGAMKFVKGDAIAGIIVILINIIAGLIIGVAMKGMDVISAVQKYTILTIGEGLVAQIPALLITVTSGMVVTRVASEESDSNLGKDIGTQVMAQPKAIGISAAFLGLLALIPGLPHIPFLILAGGIGFIAYTLSKTKEKLETDSKAAPTKPGAISAPARKAAAGSPAALAAAEEGVLALPTPSSLELSPALSAYIEGAVNDGKFMNELLPQLRQSLFMDLGVRFPGVRIRTQIPQLQQGQFMVRIMEVPLFSGSVPVKHALVVNQPAQSLAALKIPTLEGRNPVTNSVAYWVPEDKKEDLAAAGMLVWDVPTYLAVQLSAVLRRHASEFLGIQEVQSLLDAMEKQFPSLVKEVVPKVVSLFTFTDVLKRLTQEEIAIRDLRTILQALAQWGKVENDPVMLTEYVRTELKRYISFKYTGGKNLLVVYLLDPEIEEIVAGAIQQTETGNYLALEPEATQEMLKAVKKQIGNLPPSAQRPVILTGMNIRRYIKKIVELEFPALVVLSFQELAAEVRVQPVARISLKR